MRKKPFTLIYIPHCCVDFVKGKKCIHDKKEVEYSFDTEKEALEAKERVGGRIVRN